MCHLIEYVFKFEKLRYVQSSKQKKKPGPRPVNMTQYTKEREEKESKAGKLRGVEY